MTEVQKGATPFHPAYGPLGEYKPDNLINGDFHIVRSSVEVAPEAHLLRGSVLARADDGKYTLVTKETASAACCILAEDTQEGQTRQVVYLTGQFNENEVTLGEEVTADEVRDALRAFSIFLSESQK